MRSGGTPNLAFTPATSSRSLLIVLISVTLGVDELRQVLVAGGDHHLVAAGRGHARQRADGVVGLDAGHLEHRPAEQAHDLVDGLDLLHQRLGHRRALGLVLGVPGVAEGRALGVEHAGRVLGRELLAQPLHHRHDAVHARRSESRPGRAGRASRGRRGRGSWSRPPAACIFSLMRRIVARPRRGRRRLRRIRRNDIAAAPRPGRAPRWDWPACRLLRRPLRRPTAAARRSCGIGRRARRADAHAHRDRGRRRAHRGNPRCAARPSASPCRARCGGAQALRDHRRRPRGRDPSKDRGAAGQRAWSLFDF